MTDLSSFYMGLPVPSPIVAASSGLTGNVAQIKELEKYGAGAIVLKSLFEEEIVVELDRRLNKLHSENYLYPETIGFYEHDDVEDTLTNYLKLIFDAKKSVDIPVIASINCVTSKNWPSFAKYFQEAGADGLELNVFLLPSDLAVTGKNYESATLEIVRNVMKEVNIPVNVKISPYFSGLGNMLSQLSESGLQGIALFNRFFDPDFDMDALEIVPGPVYSGSGDYLNVLRWIALTAGKVKCDLYATTGIHDGITAAKMILAGAQGVQVASSLYKNGIPHLKQMNRELTDWMESKSFEGIEDFRGQLSQNNIDNPAGLLRVQFMKYFADK
jgi:dihydroorotate dehydrogenase (fumarate)